MSAKSQSGLRGTHRKTLIMAISLVVVVAVLFSFFVIYRPLTDSSDADFISVKTAAELRDAINNAEVSIPINIALVKDISLGPALVIPAGADITLKSAGGAGFFRLVGLNGVNVITVENGGRLTLDGIIVTHETDSKGCGVTVEFGGTLVLVDGEISGNTDMCGGVYLNGGSFEMAGGLISGNTATINDGDIGGGVHIAWGSFTMSGGTISGNTAYRGGGVFVGGEFKMIGGVISGNTALEYGGGVYVTHSCSFVMSGGKVSGNTAISGGGVCVWAGSFDMSGGEISGNCAQDGYGGGVYNYYGTFNKSDGEISGNTAAVGNDVHQKQSE
jgi:predicted outer membrane repeat protein